MKVIGPTRLGYLWDNIKSYIASLLGGKQDVIDDLASIRSGAALGATALQSFTETDPTVPAWAKAANKPSYTASEVGALPDSTTIPTKVSDLTNDSGFITGADVPPKVIDLGYIDAEEYDYDIEVFLDSLLESGEYKFTWGDGDDFEYYVVVESIVEDGNGFAYQKYWYTEEGSKLLYHRSASYEDGELVDSYVDNYLTLNDANSMFANVNHNHYESVTKAMSVWDYCDSSELTFNNKKPFIIYKDTLNDENWLIERYVPLSRPNDRFIRVTALGDASAIYQRSGLHNGGTTTWGDWYEYRPQIQADWNQTTTTAADYIKNKPTIPAAVTESTVSGWGFTKNTGTITGITMNGASKGTSGVVNLGTVLTEHQDISGKQDALVSGTNIKTINNESILGSGNITISGGGGGGEANIIESISINGTAQTVTSKNVDLAVPVSSTITAIVTLTEAQYTALVTKDSSTLYIITA